MSNHLAREKLQMPQHGEEEQNGHPVKIINDIFNKTT